MRMPTALYATRPKLMCLRLQELSGGDSPYTETVPGTSSSTASVAALQQQQYRALDEQGSAAMSRNASSSGSSDAPQADVATDVSELKFHADVINFVNGQLMPRLKAAAQELSCEALGVRQVLVELQGFIELADEHDCASDYRCANLIKRTLQDAYDSNTEQLPDADVIAQWLKQHSANGLKARHLLKLVCLKFICALHCALCVSVLSTRTAKS
jgi:hypothetical protein